MQTYETRDNTAIHFQKEGYRRKPLQKLIRDVEMGRYVKRLCTAMLGLHAESRPPENSFDATMVWHLGYYANALFRRYAMSGPRYVIRIHLLVKSFLS